MPRVSAAFFTVGVLCVLTGMLWGMHMGASHDMVTAPAHAHLNLVGWVTMALYGTFYTIEGDRMLQKLAWLNFFVSTAGIVVMIPALFLFLSNGNDPKFVPYMSAGEGLAVFGMLIFFVSVLRELFRRRA